MTELEIEKRKATELLETLERIAGGTTLDCGENQLGRVNMDKEAMQLVARFAVEKAKGNL
jgi:hypothetical protein